MDIYLINIFLILLYSLLIKDKKKFCIVVSIQLFLILSLRSTAMGVDLPNYEAGFSYIKNISFFDMLSRMHFLENASLVYPFSYESGYALLNWFISHIGLSFHGFLVLCALINIYSVGYFIYKYSDIPWVSFIVLCTFGIYIYFFGILRQSLALSFFLFSIDYAIKKKKIKSIVFFFIAFWMHRAVLIMLPLYLFINKEFIEKKHYIIILLLSIPFLLVSGHLYNYLVFPIMKYFGKAYIGDGFQINNLIVLIYIIAFIIIFFANFKNNNNNKMNSIAIWALVISIYVEIIGMYNDNFARIMQIYNVFLLISIPYVIKQYNHQRGIIFVKILMVLSLTLFMINSNKNSVIVPYEFETEEFIISKN